jgi:hypothetical protein
VAFQFSAQVRSASIRFDLEEARVRRRRPRPATRAQSVRGASLGNERGSPRRVRPERLQRRRVLSSLIEQAFGREQSQRGCRDEGNEVEGSSNALELRAVVAHLDVAHRADHCAAAPTTARTLVAWREPEPPPPPNPKRVFATGITVTLSRSTGSPKTVATCARWPTVCPIRSSSSFTNCVRFCSSTAITGLLSWLRIHSAGSSPPENASPWQHTSRRLDVTD